MNETDGTLQLITDHCKYTPKEPEEQGQWLVFNAEKKKVWKTSIEVPVSTPSNPVLKKAKHMSTFAHHGSTGDILFETEREFLHKILPTVITCSHQSGFLQELIDCHQMLADNTFPTSNMLHFKVLTLIAVNIYGFTNYFVYFTQ